MPYLKLVALADRRAVEIRDPAARLGRSSECALVFSGDAAAVVSGVHAELRYAAGEWRLADLASRNGTFLNGRRLDAPARLAPGDLITLGETGPRLSVVAVSEPLAPTVQEGGAIAAAALEARTPVEARAYGVTLLEAATGRRHEARGVRIRLGRGRECEVALPQATEVVSRVHAELTVGASGALMVRDAGSRTGTLLNGERIAGPVPVRLGDHITLGPGGPVLIVEGLGTSPQMPVAWPPARPGQGSRRHVLRLLGLIVTAIALLGAAVYGIYRLLSARVR